MPEYRTDAESQILYERWDAPDPEVSLLLVHGLGAHSGRWSALAEYFLKQRIASYALELQGFGRTTGIRGHIDSFEAYYGDIRSLAGIIRREHPGTRIVLVGESFGALLSFLLSAGRNADFSGLICMAPAFSIKLQVSFWDYSRVFLHLFLNPEKQFKVHFIGAMCTRDQQYQEQIDSDFREHRLVSARFIGNYFRAERLARTRVSTIDIPVLFLVPDQDKIVDPQVSKNIFKKLQAQDKSIIEYASMYHALSVELDKEQVFGDMQTWIGQKIRREVSGA